jgi:hypothetical protein
MVVNLQPPPPSRTGYVSCMFLLNSHEPLTEARMLPYLETSVVDGDPPVRLSLPINSIRHIHGALRYAGDINSGLRMGALRA